jgi:hypothetical protein
MGDSTRGRFECSMRAKPGRSRGLGLNQVGQEVRARGRAQRQIKGIIPHGGGTKGVVVGSAGTKKGRLLNSPRRPTNNETRAESEVNIVTQILFGESIHVMNERFFRECHFKQEQAAAGAI